MPPAMSGLDRYDGKPCGTRATMPAKMMKLMPLPMPRSVINSPIHMARTVPAASVTIWVSVARLRMSKSVTMPCDDRMAR